LKKYTCIFPGLYNYILTKDVGMIPYTLSDEYQTVIATYDNDNYTYLEDTLQSTNFKLDYIEKTENEKKDVIDYLKNNSKDIDILQLYHLRYNLLPWYIITYKLKNMNGLIYLKLDANNNIIDFLLERKGILPAMRRLYVKMIFRFINCISIETKRNYEKLARSQIVSPDKLLYLPNGIQKSSVKLDNKEKIILYVGYVTKKNKSIDLLLNAASKIDLNDWKILLVGEIKEDMTDFIREFFDKNAHLKDKIIFEGYVRDKKILAQKYAKSSIYCCLSESESFGLSTLEAAYFGNYIISTNVGCSPDIIEKTGYGKIINHELEDVTNELRNCIDNWQKVKENPYTHQKTIYDNYNWKNICNKLKKKLEK